MDQASFSAVLRARRASAEGYQESNCFITRGAVGRLAGLFHEADRGPSARGDVGHAGSATANADTGSDDDATGRFRGQFIPKVPNPQGYAPDPPALKQPPEQRPMRRDFRSSLRSQEGCSEPGAVNLFDFDSTPSAFQAAGAASSKNAIQLEGARGAEEQAPARGPGAEELPSREDAIQLESASGAEEEASTKEPGAEELPGGEAAIQLESLSGAEEEVSTREPDAEEPPSGEAPSMNAVRLESLRSAEQRLSMGQLGAEDFSSGEAAATAADVSLSDDPANVAAALHRSELQRLRAEGAAAALQRRVDALEGELQELRSIRQPPMVAGKQPLRPGRLGANLALGISVLLHCVTWCAPALGGAAWLPPWLSPWLELAAGQGAAGVLYGAMGLRPGGGGPASVPGAQSPSRQEAPRRRRELALPSTMAQKALRRFRRAARRSHEELAHARDQLRELQARHAQDANNALDFSEGGQPAGSMQELEQTQRENQVLRQRLELFQADIDDAIMKGRGTVCWNID